MKRLDEGHRVQVCYMELSKTFDLVNHDHSDRKLKAIEITGGDNTYLGCFPRRRTSSVRVVGRSITPTKMLSGATQRSVLGPTLFLIFNNNLARSMCNPCYRFAGDFKVLGIDLEKNNVALKFLSGKWEIPLNLAKWQTLIFGGQNRENLNG